MAMAESIILAVMRLIWKDEGGEGADEVFDRSGRLRQQQCRCQCRCEFQVSGQVSNKKEQGSYGAYEVDGGEHYARRAGHVAQGKEYAE